jgi:hypothetical protein
MSSFITGSPESSADPAPTVAGLKGNDRLPVGIIMDVLTARPCAARRITRLADRIKVLVWDGNGLVLMWKRLEQGAFPLPPITDVQAAEKVRRAAR